jgi:hypothetical protein
MCCRSGDGQQTRSRSNEVWWTAARTEVLLGESPHDPGARCAGSSVSGRTLPSQHRGDLRGFGCVPGLPPGVAPDGDGARSLPPQPHRDDTSGSARGERRSRRRVAATPGPPRLRTGPSATHSRPGRRFRFVRNAPRYLATATASVDPTEAITASPAIVAAEVNWF